MNAPRYNQGQDAGEAIVAPAEPFRLDTAEYIWLPEPEIMVPTVAVTLIDGTRFRYGSLVGFSHAATKIANDVPEVESNSAQQHLFMGLPSVLKGDRYSGIGKVENSKAQGKMLFSASRNIVKTVRLLFAIESPDVQSSVPVVLKAGISIPKGHNKLLRSLGVVQVGNGGNKRLRKT